MVVRALTKNKAKPNKEKTQKCPLWESVVVKAGLEDLPEKVTFELLLKRHEGLSGAAVWAKYVPAREASRCKSPEAGECLVSFEEL